MKDKEGLIYAILFGWCGGYRFYRKEYALGILYLLTLGLFGFGWIADIIIAFKVSHQLNLLHLFRRRYVIKN